MLFLHIGNVYQYIRESGIIDQATVKQLDKILNPEKLATGDWKLQAFILLFMDSTTTEHGYCMKILEILN